MRTTLTLDDDIVTTLKERALRARKTFKDVLNQTLRAGLAVGEAAPRAKRYRLEPASLGGVQPGIDLDKALSLSDALEDQSLGQRLEMRK